MVYYLEKMETKEGVQAFIDFSKPILEAHQVKALVCTGATIERCIETVCEHRFLSENLCGALLYRQLSDQFTFWDRESLVGNFI